MGIISMMPATIAMALAYGNRNALRTIRLTTSTIREKVPCTRR